MLIVWKGVALHDVLVEDGNEAAFSDSRRQAATTTDIIKRTLDQSESCYGLIWFDFPGYARHGRV